MQELTNWYWRKISSELVISEIGLDRARRVCRLVSVLSTFSRSRHSDDMDWWYSSMIDQNLTNKNEITRHGSDKIFSATQIHDKTRTQGF